MHSNVTTHSIPNVAIREILCGCDQMSDPQAMLVTSDQAAPSPPGLEEESYWFVTGTLLGNVHSIIANYSKTITATFCLTMIEEIGSIPFSSVQRRKLDFKTRKADPTRHFD